MATIVLENGINLRECMTTGSLLDINSSIDDYFEDEESAHSSVKRCVDTLGQPVTSFDELEKDLSNVDESGFVKKKILVEGGGSALDDRCTVSIAFSGYWENEPEPFDSTSTNKPLEVNLKDNALLPGLQIAVKSMLVGEVSQFLLSYQVMFGIMGVPPKIKPKAKCVYYIKVTKSIFTPLEGKLDLKESNMFKRVMNEVRILYFNGQQLYQVNNFMASIQFFKKCIGMLHRCRLADEKEEQVQQNSLLKLYMNLAICYNKVKQPLRTCTACNEINNISNIWNNGKALYHNAQALRMIGDFQQAEKKLNRAMKLRPNDKDILKEKELLKTLQENFTEMKLIANKVKTQRLVTDEFKTEVEDLIRRFKEDVNVCKLILPPQLTSEEVAYIKEACQTNNIFFNKVHKKFALDKVIDDNIGKDPIEIKHLDTIEA